MAVTDLTDSMPWWARNGSQGPQGAGPTGTPSAAPQGAGGQPGAGDSASWLQYLVQMYGPQQAMAMMQGGAGQGGQAPNPADMPSPNASNVNMVNLGDGSGNGGFNPPPGPQPPITNFGNPAPTNGPGPGNVGPVNLNAANVTQPQPPQGPPVGAGMLDQSGVQRGPMGVLRTQPGASAPVGAGLPDQSGVARNPAGVLTPGGAAPAPAAPVRGPLAAGGAGGQGATSNPRFVQLDRGQNMDPTSRMGSPNMTALNLAGLFNRGQPAVNPNAPAANAQPVALNNVGKRLVPGPLASAPMPPVMPGNIRNQRVKNAIANPNWWRNL